MATVTIDKLNFPQPVVVSQTVSIYYKLATAPVTDYVLVSAGVVIGTDGVPLSPPAVSGLTEELSYDFLIYNTTCSPSKEWVQTITIPA